MVINKKKSKKKFVLWQILQNMFLHYFREDGAAYASHMTLSGLLAVFPFLIFSTSLASFLGAGKYATESVNYLFTITPAPIAKVLTKEIIKVLTIQRGGILTISGFMAAYFASNGIEALRTALNRAYRIKEERSIFFCRIQSLFFVILGTIGLIAISLLLILAPLILNIAENLFPAFPQYMDILKFWRYLIAILIALICILSAYKWLPAGKRSFLQILPGAIFTLCTWFCASIIFGQYLAHFANYVSTYAGLASLMIALIFLYISSAIFILGGELNTALMLYKKQRSMPAPTIKMQT